MGEEEVEVGEHEIAEVHQPWASIVGTDVCVLPAAFPRAPPPSEGMVGWRAEVQRKRGSAVKANQQVQLFGAWFALMDTDRILPMEQLLYMQPTRECYAAACSAECLAESSQLADAVQRAAKLRHSQRISRAIEAAADAGTAETVHMGPGETIFSQGDRSGAFYLIEKGEVQMSLTPTRDDYDEDDDSEPAAVLVRKYGPGECFGASGLMAGDGTRRNTATAISPVTLKVIPHKHFRVMLRDDNFLKAGLLSRDAVCEHTA